MRGEGARRSSAKRSEGGRVRGFRVSRSHFHDLKRVHRMRDRESNWWEHQSNIHLRPNANLFLRPDPKLYLRPDPKLYLRHDAHRFLPPQADERKYSPNQPRVAAGNPDGGQWTSGGDGSDVSKDARVTPAALQLPRVPNSRPPTPQERNRTARELARWGRDAIVGAIAGGATWLNEQWASIESYFDPPKSLEELQQGVSDPRPGYDIHHIVERDSAAEDGSETEKINAQENLVRIPRWKHWEINSWYQTKNEAYGFLSPREYLRGKSWDVRMRVGHDALIDVGVLK
jgi:hypothetical protein